ncbi:vanin-like protein 2 [Uranotaenia lowii]|uniref:vanin-like protein 2 n=1 Tax=Uranotaenia lowii TaxID=190385 RepID=UPI00247AF645|nr:vanin-like protein 2 [Uranotaenia lowii]XP_055594725.1 vanin-like protein 2 [Uranotaenia lowii]XP_055594726.1 vanin-like protein 2 [Uranotaenia lowii]XP_055594727.1 vanin-like protein 2 [Uranotaenia lowii]XP_055594728.1 vanin-like protein 2 [Uranotaenia lowii]XP_055594729.1 vanin-like protein 2 [Uranotaenia lowii]
MNRIVYLYGTLLFVLSQSASSRQLFRGSFEDDDTHEAAETDFAAPVSTRHVPSSKSSHDDSSYLVGVIEFRPELLNMDIRQRTELHLEAYEQLIRSEEAQNLDIIVFPELTLNTLSDPVYVPEPPDAIIPCRPDSPELLSRVSCLAAETGKYIVINLSEIFNCDSTPEDDPRPCGPHGFHRYNTDVVFDRNGAVIARYRKFNLFREPGTNTTHLPEIVTFETDFGVTFGIFTCFDLLFARPALELVKRDVTDIIFPSMWVSEPPFLTSTQIFESWAYANNVNLIASGTNYAPAGSTGTGVFNGRNGAVFSFVTGEATRRLFPVRVPKIKRDVPAEEQKETDTFSGRLHGKKLEDIRMGRDFLEYFTTMQINPERYHDEIGQIICNGDFCCDFSVKLTVIPDREVTHHYRFAVFDGDRTFQGYVDAHVSICGIIACRNESLASCGLPLHENSNYLELEEIFIKGRFDANGTLAMPNSLDDMLHSLDKDYYQFHSVVNYSTNQQNVEMILTNPVANLQTFAIYAFNHKNFEFFNPIDPPQEPMTENPSPEDQNEDDDGGCSPVNVSTALVMGLLLLVSTVLPMRCSSIRL